MAFLTDMIYVIDQRKAANWSLTQEKAISRDYPFDLQEESLNQFVARTYLQFLWLPESIMPLHLLIPSLQRVNAPSSSDASGHPMHTFLAPLLLTTRTTSNKYHVELPQILADGGGAGEMEETMMWYALTHERAEDVPPDAEGPWVDEKWRQWYLERMERREVQIQILLYLYKLSLPGPPPSERIEKRRRSRKPVEPTLSVEDHLEAFMDKLSMWQLVGALDSAKSTVKKDERDWMQVFSEDVVDRQFKTRLPDSCSLLQSKVFPSSPFSDDDLNASISRNPSPEPPKKYLSRAPSISRLPSPALSASSRATTKSGALARSRSRSLSISLAQEQQERERAANAAPSKKRILNREISMSRVFKPRPKPQVKATAKTEAAQLPKAKQKPARDLGVTLVDETPVKPRVASATMFSFGQPSFFGVEPMKEKAGHLASVEEDDGDEEWMMDRSPDVVLLNPTRSSSTSSGIGGMDSDEEVALVPNTPSKPSRRRK